MKRIVFALLLTLIFGCVLVYKYIPLRSALFLRLPEPNYFNREIDRYKKESFGAPIQAGFFKIDITPPRFSWLAGYYPPHPGVFIHDRLWVKSLALRDAKGNTAVIVSCDLIGILPDEVNKIKSLVKNIPADKIFISATHTHSGPDTMGLWGIPPFSGKNEKYIRNLRVAIAYMIDQSVMNLEKAKIRFAQGELLDHNEGREKNPPDTSISAMQILLNSGELVTLVNFAVHPDEVKSLSVSADFPYYLDERLKMLVGGETMFFPGAIGGVQPPGDNNTDSYFVRSLGEDLADRAWILLRDYWEAPEKIDISFKKITVKAPLENKKFLWAARLGLISDLRNSDGEVSTEINLIKIGPANIITVPGELFPKIWKRARMKMKGRLKFIFGLTNGELGYILLPEDFYSGKHNYHAGMSVGAKFGEEIDKALQKLVTE